MNASGTALIKLNSGECAVQNTAFTETYYTFKKSILKLLSYFCKSIRIANRSPLFIGISTIHERLGAAELMVIVC